MEYIDLSGIWHCRIPGQSADALLPGTLDENRIGFPDKIAGQWHPDNTVNEKLIQSDGIIATRLTRKYQYEGPAEFTRKVQTCIPEGKRVFLEAERDRCLTLKVNGSSVPDYMPPTLVTPHIFEVTGLLTGEDELMFLSDNSYPGLPYGDITCASAATNETQTNWNGILGYLRLRLEDPVFIQNIRIYTRTTTTDVVVTIDADRPWQGTVFIESEALLQTEGLPVSVSQGIHEVHFSGLKRNEDVKCWDDEEGNLYQLTVRADGLEAKQVTFGIREFTQADGHLLLNGRKIFLRSESNCAVFPETGYPPMDADAWIRILQTYRSYGVNCMRFHSHVPPDAAFEAADTLGMLMQPELSHWNPRNAFETEESFRYYKSELEQLILHLANHPSFVMLTLGNELHAGALGHQRMDEMLVLARKLDNTRLYANASNDHYGQRGCDWESDFYTAMCYYGDELRLTSSGMEGPLNHRYPDARLNYSQILDRIRETYDKPVFSFEVGQYEILPDFEELQDFQGVTRPDNLDRIRRNVAQRGLMDWEKQVEATGELALLCYRAEVEAALRTENLSGISLLGLQDFPGQGTALVGMLNSHLQSKPYPFAQPERFRAFFRDVLPLVFLERYTYETGERLAAVVRVANYGKETLYGCLHYRLHDREGELPQRTVPCGGLTEVGTIDLLLSGICEPTKLTLTVDFAGNVNSYPVWVYPPVKPVCPDSVYETAYFDAKAEEVLQSGGTVYLSPDSDEIHLPSSIQAQFSTDFWSVGTFPVQGGGMGQLIDNTHSIFRNFPTEAYSNWQWWPMANQRAFILPKQMETIIAELDSYAYLRPMAKLFEGRCCGGRILVSSLGLQNLQQYPEARALQDAIYKYLASVDFAPLQEIEAQLVRKLVNNETQKK